MEEAPRSNLRSSRRTIWIVVPLAALVLGGGAWMLLRDRAPDTLQVTPAAAPTAETAPAPATAAPAPAVVPATAAEARALLEPASADPAFRAWLAAGDVVRRWAQLTADVAEGTSPHRLLVAFAPRERFSVARRGEQLVIAPASFARYDGIAAAIGAVDARLAATAYRRLHGVLEAAYRALGYPNGSLDAATARALRRLANVPVPADAPVVVPGEGGYVYADASLEQRTDVEKQLLRMGPHNAGLVQAKARELLEVLELPAVASKR